MYISRPEKQGGSKLMFVPFEIVSIRVWLLYFFSEICCTAAYSHLFKKHMLWLHVTDECLEQSFLLSYSAYNVDELVCVCVCVCVCGGFYQFDRNHLSVVLTYWHIGSVTIC